LPLSTSLLPDAEILRDQILVIEIKAEGKKGNMSVQHAT
jgi:hypothetical protein